MSVKMQNYYIWTIGCQMNKADSERLTSALDKLGMQPSTVPQEADLIVLNSCVVRQSAEDKVTGMLTSLKPLKLNNKEKIVALMGCMVGPETSKLKSKFPYVDVFMRPQQYEPLIDLLAAKFDMDTEGCLRDLTPSQPNISTYIPIIHGCDEFCSFCIIPYRRGRQQSRTIQDINREVTLLVERGVKEVTLLGQTVDAYGHDLDDKPDLSDLMTSIHDIEGLQRIRFLTSHPKYMSERIIKTIAELPKVCEHINLPFQAGDDQVLTDMRRGYTSLEYKNLVKRIRDTIPNVSLATDVIVGFPGETNVQFESTVALIKDLEFDKVHIAAYSPRPNTIAIRKMTDNISHQDKKDRVKILETLQEEISAKLNARLMGNTLEVLIDGNTKGKWHGRTRNDKLVFIESDRSPFGQTLDVTIDRTGPWSLNGTIT
jgi:tRNA-2-methylthio-N6-dimethylallyladenosine synthase